MAIIRSAQAHNSESNVGERFGESDIPFVPAWDLLTAQQNILSTGEAAAIGVSLYLMTADRDQRSSTWGNLARLDAVSHRM